MAPQTNSLAQSYVYAIQSVPITCGNGYEVIRTLYGVTKWNIFYGKKQITKWNILHVIAPRSPLFPLSCQGTSIVISLIHLGVTTMSSMH